jgi:hypothetical protein
MSNLDLKDNTFLRQYEVCVEGHLAKIEYAAQEKKIFLTKLVIPEQITSKEFKDDFIRAVLDHIQTQKNEGCTYKPPDCRISSQAQKSIQRNASGRNSYISFDFLLV